MGPSKPTFFAFLILAVAATASAQIGGSGWVSKAVVFKVQSPTNAPESARYFVTNDPYPIYHCLVYSNDGAFSVGNTTLPRTEQRFTPDYTNGDIQYQSMEMAPSNENSYCVFQIHTGDAQSDQYGSTTFMLFWFTNDDGSVRDYSGTELAKNLGNKWFQLNVDHNVADRAIKVWINQNLVWTQQDNGAGDFYFKDGVYEQSHNPTYEMDTYISNILMWTSAESPLTWVGQTNGVNVDAWDLGTTADWANSTNHTSQAYQDGSPVTFDDSAPGSTTVNLQTLLNPASVTVSNAIKDYAFTGTGGLGGSTALAKYGVGTLAVDTTNSFTGGVLIAGGILQPGDSAALGSTSGGTVITNGGTLDVNGVNLTGESVTVSGAGAGGNGAIINNGAQQTSALRNVTLTGDATFGGTGRWDIRDSGGAASLDTSPTGSAFNLTKVGPNQVSLVGVSSIDSALGNIDIQQGTFAIQTSTTQVGDPAKTITIHGGAVLDLYELNGTALNKQIVVDDGGAIYDEKGPSFISGPLSLDGAAIFNVANNGSPPALTVSNVISGPGSLTVTGGGDLVLADVNPYTGATTVSQGTLSLSGAGSIFSSTNIDVAASAVLDASGRNDGTLALADGQTLAGNGAIAGNVIVGSGATLAPGGSLTTLILSNNLTLNSGGTTILEVSKSPVITNDEARVAENLVYGGALVITNIGVTPLAAGDSFQIFDAAHYSGSFAGLMPPAPGPGLAWDTSGLTYGVLSVVAATPPQIGSIQLAGGNLVITGHGGAPGAGYYILASTNLSLPVSQWTVIDTNAFDSNGNFTFSNSPGPNAPAMFYQVRYQ